MLIYLFVSLYRVIVFVKFVNFGNYIKISKNNYESTSFRWGRLGSIVEGGQGTRARFIPVLRECIWNASTVSIVLPSFDGIGSLGSPPRQVVYPPGSMVLP